MAKVPRKPKERPKVYLVEDNLNSPGRILAVFASEEDANWFAAALEVQHRASVEARTLWYGQPDFRGFNE